MRDVQEASQVPGTLVMERVNQAREHVMFHTQGRAMQQSRSKMKIARLIYNPLMHTCRSFPGRRLHIPFSLSSLHLMPLFLATGTE
jgi:hypothetical protein